jgi:sugar phosphate isomerase/epimerase
MATNEAKIKKGLLTISFRQLEPQTIVDLVKEAQLDCIEWGGDLHVPHGDIAAAEAAAAMTVEAGLEVAAYGSYYRVGVSEGDGLAFQSVLDSAIALGAPVIRVWAGIKGSAEADQEDRDKTVEDSLRIADLAAAHDITLVYEWHSRSLTDTLESGLRLIQAVDHSHVKTLWQPDPDHTVEENLAELTAVSDYLVNLHVYHWVGEERRPLEEGKEDWKQYFEVAAAAPGEHSAMLEFVRDDSPEAFLEDAETLRRL